MIDIVDMHYNYHETSFYESHPHALTFVYFYMPNLLVGHLESTNKENRPSEQLGLSYMRII